MARKAPDQILCFATVQMGSTKASLIFRVPKEATDDQIYAMADTLTTKVPGFSAVLVSISKSIHYDADAVIPNDTSAKEKQINMLVSFTKDGGGVKSIKYTVPMCECHEGDNAFASWFASNKADILSDELDDTDPAAVYSADELLSVNARVQRRGRL